MSDVKNATDAIEALRQVVAGREDYVYPGAAFGECFNFQSIQETPYYSGVPGPREARTPEDLKPSCVVGHVLDLWGLDRKYWFAVEGGIGTSCGELRDIWREHGDVFRIDGEAETVLNCAQVAQDRGRTWGEALASAEARYELVMQKKAGESSND
jgi:hypothetical protein